MFMSRMLCDIKITCFGCQHALDVSMRLFSCEITGSKKSPLGCRRKNLFCVKEQSITLMKTSLSP